MFGKKKVEVPKFSGLLSIHILFQDGFVRDVKSSVKAPQNPSFSVPAPDPIRELGKDLEKRESNADWENYGL